MFDRRDFESQKIANIDNAFHDFELIENGRRFVSHSDRYMYAYNWTCLGLPVIQMPEDIVLMQELMWEIKPDFVVEADSRVIRNRQDYWYRCHDPSAQ
jgi:cephalosporin hydroxylase